MCYDNNRTLYRLADYLREILHVCCFFISGTIKVISFPFIFYIEIKYKNYVRGELIYIFLEYT